MFYSQETQSPANRAQHRTDVSMPMRDGVALRADILLPSAEGKFPALIYRTPYGKHFALKEYKTFEKAVARGYAVVWDAAGRVVKNAATVKPGAALELEFYNGKVGVIAGGFLITAYYIWRGRTIANKWWRRAQAKNDAARNG